MSTLAQYQTYAETALASYATLLAVGSGVNRQKWIDAEMSAAQAGSFDSRWSVLAQSEGHLSGFSAVLLQNVQTGQKALAIRGTDGAADFITDIVNISIFGSVLGMPQYVALEAFYADLLSTGQLAASDQLVLTGHSLGGFLAQAFTARHPSVVSAAYTFNAPGFGGGLAQAVEFLGVTDGSIAHSKIVNIHATDGLSVTAGLGAMLGSTEMVRIEPGTAVQNHSIKTVTDALAVQAAYQQLQPGLSTTQIGALFAAAGMGERRLEDALDALRTVFIGSASNDVNRTPTGDRDRLYINLQALSADAGFQALSGHVRLETNRMGFASAAQAATQAALAYRYALLELLPFAVVADTEADNQTLYGPYVQRLSLVDEATGQGELTSQWLTDRAVLVEALAARNLKNGTEQIAYSPALPTHRSYELRWLDAQGAEQILIAENTARRGGVNSPPPSQLIAFGGGGNDTLAGSPNQLGDHLYGGAGDDTLNGLAGADYLEGNAGNDTYYVSSGDTVTESSGASTDTVISDVTWTLGNNLENLTLAGTGAINGTGNTLTNVMRGNAAANTLIGGAGNDTYEVDNTADVVTELAGEGTDLVRSSVTYSLSANVENLTLTGTSALNATGNTLDNGLTGNSAANTLTGNAGADRLDGGAGADILTGGTGNDTYVLGRGYGAETINENDTTAGNTDVMSFLAGVATDQLWLRKVSNNLEVSIIGTSDRATITNWYLGSPYRVEQFKTADGKTLLDSQVQNLVNAMAAFSPPAAGQTTLPANYQTALAPVIAANWQ